MTGSKKAVARPFRARSGEAGRQAFPPPYGEGGRDARPTDIQFFTNVFGVMTRRLAILSPLGEENDFGG